MTSETSGLKSHDASSSSDPTLSSLKTCPASSPSDPPSCRPIDAYAAGLIDGEGCLYIGPNLRPVVQIGMAMKGRPTLERLAREYGGRFRTAWKGNARWSEEIRWTIQSAELVAMLRRISPHLTLKQEQARLLQRAADIHDELPKIGRKRWTPEARERVETIRKRVMELNRRGPSTEPVIEEGAIALLVAGQWVSPQFDLLSDLGYTPFSETWPRSAIQRSGVVYELPTWARLTDESAGSASPTLLPTPSAEESTPTDEYVREVRDHIDAADPHHRLWLPGRRWMAQRTLSRTAAALLPTPGANDATGAELETRDARRDRGTGGPSLRDLPKLLPTPVVTDSFGSRRSTARTDEWESHPGTTLTDAIWETQGRETDTRGNLLPTPTSRDGKGANPNDREGGADLPGAVELLPTPVANPDNPGSGGELRAALVHGEGRRNETGTDTMGRPNEGRPSRLLPTPQAADGDGGRQEKGAMGRAGVRPSGQKATLPLPTAVGMREEISETPFTAAPTVQPSLFDAEATPPDLALPTPRVTSERNSRKAMVENDQWSSVSLGQAAEIAAGELPREFDSWDEVPGELGRQARELLPTPQAADGERSSEQGVRFYAGGGDNPTLLGAARRTEVSWGVYEGAVRRWESICGRTAPSPTDEKGRLDPPFVEWMLGYPRDWFVLEPALARTAQLRALGNSVQVDCGEAVGHWLAGLLDVGLI